MSSVRELASGALVLRHCKGAAGAAAATASSGQPSSIHFWMNAISAGSTGASPDGMRLVVASGAASGRSAPKGVSPLRDLTRLEPAPLPTEISDSPSTFLATNSLRLRPRQNAL